MIATCPKCGLSLQNHVSIAGQLVLCPYCSGQFRMPPLTDHGGGESRSALFLPDAFEVATVEQAKAIIVVGHVGATTDQRWENETVYLIEDIGRFLPIDPDSCVLDYGCGIGRVAKPLIERFGCRVVGVDSSRSMRGMALAYVHSDRFAVWSVEELDARIGEGFQAHFCLSLWVIQHVLDPVDALERIARALRPGGLVYALNQAGRCVPTDQGWVDDGFDVPEALRSVFAEEEMHALPTPTATPEMSAATRIQVLRKRLA
jgi:SAM-dependent methyltransferase